MSSTPIYPSNFAATPPGQRKVAIPRLQRPGPGHNATKDRRRVPRACTACRSHKIKCTGERPHCKHCATTNRECVYIMPRKDRLKIVTERCQQMASLLKGLKSCANAEDEAKIADILEAVDEDMLESSQTAMPPFADTDANGSQGSREVSVLDYRDELDTDSLDLLDEDLHVNDRARATGFVGKNSEVQWLRLVAVAQLGRTDDEDGGATYRQGPYTPGIGNEQISSYSFWTDSESVEIDFFVDPYDLPLLETAERLLSCYMSKVHDSFPILPRKTFEDQFRKYFTALQNGNAPRLSPKWQAILNLVFAIGAKYSHLSKASWRADARDHLIYQARARAFGLNDTTMTSHSDVPQIQSLGLLAFYWLSIGQVSRSWTIIGLALRSAYALGLHVRNEDPSATASKRETLVRTWWSLYSLERTLSIITGRPSIIVDSCCSVPLPMPVTEEQISDQVEATYRMRKGSSQFMSPPQIWPNGLIDPRTPVGLGTTEANSGSYFKAAVQLAILTQNILTSLYTASASVRSAAGNQQEMTQLSQRLDQWVLSLPREFNFQEPITNASMAFSRERMLLAFQLCGARMLLGRLGLNPRRPAWREGDEATFARQMGNSCIEAARTVVDFLPDEPNTHFIYDQGPWWCMVHYMMQAVSVFLLGLSYPASTSQDSMVLIYYVKKVIRWLQAMQDPVAERAYQVALSSFETVSRRYPVDVGDIWRTGPIHGSNLQNIVDPSMTAYPPTHVVPSQVVPSQVDPQATAMATYAAYDVVSTGTTYPGHHGLSIMGDGYTMPR